MNNLVRSSLRAKAPTEHQRPHSSATVCCTTWTFGLASSNTQEFLCTCSADTVSADFGWFNSVLWERISWNKLKLDQPNVLFVSKFPRTPKWSKNWKFQTLSQILGNSFYSIVPPTGEMRDRRLAVIGSSPSRWRIIVQTCLENTQETRMCWIVSSAWSHRETHQIQHLFSCSNIFTLGWIWKYNFSHPLFLPFPESITGAKALHVLLKWLITIPLATGLWIYPIVLILSCPVDQHDSSCSMLC